MEKEIEKQENCKNIMAAVERMTAQQQRLTLAFIRGLQQDPDQEAE